MSSSLWSGAPGPWRAGIGGPRGTFTKQDDNSFTGTLKTLNVTANLSIVPVAKASDNAPDHRVYAGAGHSATSAFGAGGRRGLEPGRQVQRRNLPQPQDRRARIRPPIVAFRSGWVRARLVKLERPGDDGTTHIALWEPRDR